MKLIDISHELDNDTPIFPGGIGTTLAARRTLAEHGYNAKLLKSFLHAGTHVDMPGHFFDDARTVKDFPLEGFCGRGVLLDVRGDPVIDMKPAYRELVTERSIVLLYTGWDAAYHTEAYFMRHPEVTDEFAAFLLSRRVKALGMDMPAPDYPPHPVHRALLGSGVFVLENLTNLQSLAGLNSFEVMALPLKIDAEASFVRAVGVVGE